MNNETSYGFPRLKWGGETISIGRVLRTLAGLAIVVQAVFFAQPDTFTFTIKIAAGILLIDVKLFRAWLKRNGK